ncbi:hypothetical protein ABLE92_01605 [Gordonia sp. VNQ95]|uniref:hypothetical protein n=1 Tax=Gordonia sp. VNQ95 TaxID=3156619 RepID=UPI0032B5BA3C
MHVNTHRLAARACFAGLSATLLALSLCACDGEEPLESRVTDACTDAIRKHASFNGAPQGVSAIGWDYSHTTVTSIAFSDLHAEQPPASDTRETKAWTITGKVTAKREQSVPDGTWDDDGEPNPIQDLTYGIECAVGYRASDDTVVVFNLRTIDLVSGGSLGTTLMTTEPAP